MIVITINCNAGCGMTMANYTRYGRGESDQEELEALMTAKGIPLDAAEVDWNCGCTVVDGKPRPSMTFPNYTPVEE